MNVVLYLPLGIVGYLTIVQYFQKTVASLTVLAFSLVLSTGIEFAQLFEPSRFSSAFDVCCNFTGAALGLVVARSYDKSLTPLLNWGAYELFRPFNSCTILFTCWIGYQTIPLIPQLSRTQLMMKLGSFATAGSWSIVEILAGIVDWLTLGALVEEVASPQASGLVMAGLLLLLPLRLFIEGRSLTATECVSASVGYLIWRIVLEKRLQRFFGLAALAAAMLVLRGLAPFRFTATSQFSWVPFAATLSYDQADALVVLARKCFLYGAAVWLCRKAGGRYFPWTLGIAALLGAIEAVQVRIPGRTPEITDPVLAFIMAAVLYLTDRNKKSAVTPAATSC